jgi:DNA-binding NtrC family response regulator
MAGMDGIETLKLIKKSYPLVEVIMLTGYPQVDDAIDCMRFGAYDYLKKVVDFDNLLVKITLAKQKKLTGEENALK